MLPKFVIDNHGIDEEQSYPYQSKKNTCAFRSNSNVTTIRDYVLLHGHDEDYLKQVVANIGPIAVFIDASPLSFKHYHSGILREPHCHNRTTHFVTVVGYGEKDGIDYWKIKNSWGEHYGEKGYIYMARNFENMCWISKQIMYPVMQT